MTEEYNFKNLCDLTTSVLGLPKGSLALKSRKRELQVARAINIIYKAYKDIGGTKEFFLDKDFMKSYLLKNGVKETLDFNVVLEVKSGQSVCEIKTSFFDFSNQLENVKFALKDYHYTIKII